MSVGADLPGQAPRKPDIGRRRLGASVPLSTPEQETLPLLVPLLAPRERKVFAALAGCWLLGLGAFWTWWLQPEHNLDSFRFVLNCLVLFWTTVVPGYFVLIFARARIPNPARRPPAGLRVAMVVTKAPSEPFEIVRLTLVAMLAQSYPHDTWLADEDPDADTAYWCLRHGVRLSCRKGIPAYHNASWPRRTRCKEGNLAYFYDHYGYAPYDVVVQMDADHVPSPGYLEAMLVPFADPHVGYVSAPSMCDSNAADSWAARGRLHVEAALHGSLQAGHNGGLAPMCIGSHYAVRTAALLDIGGLGPELAEDHSTTLIMNARGWRGVHALNALAHGEGPATFADLATQEYQWSKSLAVILFRYMPRYIGTLPARLKAQFLFAQLWYPLFSLSMAASVVMPIVALLTRRVWADVVYLQFFVHAVVVTAAILILMSWVRTTGSLRPRTAKIVSWEGLAFLFARWPWSLLGLLSAVADCVRGREFPFRVTPKGKAARLRPPLAVVLPYLLLSLACTIPLVAVDNAGNAAGFYIISGFNGLVYLALALLIVVAHARESGYRLAAWRLVFGGGTLAHRALAASAMLALALGLFLRAPDGAAGLLWTGKPDQTLLVGVYDPEQAFANDRKNVDVEHVFVSLAEPGTPALIYDWSLYARARGRSLLVSVEPWSAGGDRPVPTLLDDVSRGRYDREIDQVCTMLGWLNEEIMVRWGHEMEASAGRYPWETQDPAAYIAAYRHFVGKCRSAGPKLRFVWSPRGEPALTRYFPGHAYVDYVGLSLFDCVTCTSDAAAPPPSASRMLKEKYQRVHHYGLPVIVAEFGIDGGPQRQRTELADLQAKIGEFPQLQALVYFNAIDTPRAWPEPFRPDWRLSPALLDTLTRIGEHQGVGNAPFGASRSRQTTGPAQ